MTLALLITAVGGAWAQTEITTIPNGDFETWTYDGEDMPNNWNSNATSDGSLNGIYGGKQLKRSTDVRPGSSGQYSCSIWSKSIFGVTNIGILTSGRIHFGSSSSSSSSNYIYSDRDGSNTKNNVTNPCAMPFTGKPTAIKVWVKYVQGGTGYGDYATAKFSATIHGDADYVAYNLAEDDNDDNKALVVASAEQEIAYNNGEWEQLTIPFNYTDNNVEPAYILINAYTNAYPGKGKANDYLYIDDIELEYASASSGPEVAWDKAKKTGSFTMPGGNVTLEPEYYPQATVAEGAVTAADADARATTDDPLVKVDATKLTGAKKLMYFVSNSGTTAPAYDAEGWTDQLPTAEGFTQQGIVYVWYYPVGTDEGVDGATATYSDGDICLESITARIADAPTYAVTFADDTAEPDKWTAEPATGVKKGTAVTVTYTGSKKVIGVKVEKKAETPAVQARTWNFTQWSEATVNNIKADAAASKTEGWSDIEKEKDAKDGKSAGETEDKCFWYQGEVNSDGTLSANGSVIEELKGLKFNEEYASRRDLAIAVDYSSTSLGDYAGGAYLMLGGGKVQSPDKRICCFTIPNVKIGQKITVVVESHKPSTRRGISLFVNSVKDDGNKIGDSFMPTTKESYTWENWTLPDGITADGDTVDILVCNNDACHIYSITVE